jgi:O-antigen ligase
MRALARIASVAAWVFLVAGLVAAPLLYGSGNYRPQGWPFWPWQIPVLLLLLGGFCAALRFGLGREKLRVPLAAASCAGLMAALAAVQCVPLPRGAVETLSPERARQDALALEGLAQPSSRLALSVEPALTSAHAWKWAGYAVAIVVTALLLRRRAEARRLFVTMAILAGAQALFAAIALFARWDLPHTIYQGRATGTFVNPNQLAAFLELGLFIALGAIFDRIRRMRVPDFPTLGARVSAVMDAPDFWKCALLAGLAALITMGLIVSQSRGGLFAAVAGFVVFSALFARDKAKLLVFPALLLLLGAAWYVGVEPLQGRLEHMLSELHAGLGRVQIWGAALSIFGDYPAVGAGLGAFRFSQVPHWPAHAAGQMARYAHNDYLDTLAGGGAVGAVLLLGMLAAAGWVAVRRLPRGASPLLLGAVSGLVAVSAHCLVDFNWQIVGVGAWFFAVAGAVHAPCFRTRPVETRWSAVAVPSLLAFLAIAGVGSLAERRAPDPDRIAEARALRRSGADPSRVLAESLARSPMTGLAHVERGWWAVRRGDLALADECFKRARGRDPGDLRVLDHARLYWIQRLDPQKPTAEVFEELAAATGPILWSGERPPQDVLRETLEATQSIDFLMRLVPPEGHQAKAGWERYIRGFVESRVK